MKNLQCLGLGMFGLCAISPAVGLCDAIYFPERVINRAELKSHGNPVPDIPTGALDRYRNNLGVWSACQVVQMGFYPQVSPALTNCGAYPPLQPVQYPANANANILALRLVPDNSPGDNGNTYYWNLVGTSMQPGFVYVDPLPDPDPAGTRRYVQFADLTLNQLEQNGIPNGEILFQDEKIYYRISTNGGATFNNPNQVFRQLIQQGQTIESPLQPMRVGTDGASLPAISYIGAGYNGDLLVPISITDHTQTDHLPGEPQVLTSYSNGYVLRGAWNISRDDLTWTLGAAAHVQKNYSTRGIEEPAILELDSTGRCIMVGRGSTQSNSNVVAGHYWLFQSVDGCRTWTGEATPWGFSDGTAFFAPAANSILFRSPQNNRVYWIGSMSASNADGDNPSGAQGNWPRTTLVAAEVDVQNLGIIKDTATIVDRMDVAAGDTDGLQLNNQRIAIRPSQAASPDHPAFAGSAFVYWPREDFGHIGEGDYTAPASWYQIAPASGSNASLNVTPSSNLQHQLSWASSNSNIVHWHLRRRYLSGNPLTDLWEEVGPPFPATSTGTTIAGYLPWQEAEYEVVAERADGGAEVSNRVTARFAQWQGPRLSFSFPVESVPGTPVPTGQVSLSWSYPQTGTLSAFRLFRRFYNSDNQTHTVTVTPWETVGDLPATQRTVTLAGYLQTNVFDLYLLPIGPPVAQSSNVIAIRFPKKTTVANDPLPRLPY